ncbi:hypothetical protein GGR33_002038 [Methylobacterium brachythecii]|uniref:Uncharacterized protein n=1 Tax=Methylobacterium brachythecii TaxID=1176177 RepID=A0A7W6AFV0_9HYPH|nr:hypothetical protein [Methylobacterium brachythecii]
MARALAAAEAVVEIVSAEPAKATARLSSVWATRHIADP